MYALVLWDKGKEATVLHENLIIGAECKPGSKVEVSYGSRKYSATVILTSDDEEWLKKQEVTTKGKLIPPGKTPLLSETLAAKKDLLQSSKKTASAVQKVRSTHASKLLSIADNIDAPSEKAHKNVGAKQHPVTSKKREPSEKEVSSENTPKVKKPRAPSMANKQSQAASNLGDDEKKDENLDEMPGIIETMMLDFPKESREKMDRPKTSERQVQETAKPNECETCLTFPQASPENLKFLSNLLTFTTAHYEVQFNRQIENDPGDSLAKKGLQTIRNEINAGKVELKPGSGIFIHKDTLKDLLRDFGKKPTSLLRRLVRILVGDVFLVGMSAMGEGGYDPIPAPVMDAIKDLWIKFPKIPKLSPTQFTRTINVLCSQLRGKGKEKSNSAEAAANGGNKNQKKTDSKASTASTSPVKKLSGRGGTWTVSPMKTACHSGIFKVENLTEASSVKPGHHTATPDLPASPASSPASSVRSTVLSPSGSPERPFTQSTSRSATSGGVQKTPSPQFTSTAVRTIFPVEYSDKNAVKNSVENSRWQTGHVDSVNTAVAPANFASPAPGGYDQSGQYSYPYYPDTRFFSPPPSTSSYPFSSYYYNPNQPPPGSHYQTL